MSAKDLSIFTFPTGKLACNCSLIYSPQTREAIAIDPGSDADAFMGEVAKLNVKVKFLLHTHAHFDHIGHADVVRQRLGTPIYLHKGDLFLYEALQQQAIYFGDKVAKPEGIDHFIEHEEEFALNINDGLQDNRLRTVLKSIHTPGHTPGSCSFYCDAFDEPILFSGDTLFANSIGRTDLPGGDFSQIIRSIKQR
jgi:hydroxyacylglutathione hydrolase